MRFASGARRLNVFQSRLFSTHNKKPCIGFIGLGHMGAHMAANLQRAGHMLVVHDLSKEATEVARESGAIVAESPRAVAEQVSTLITMLPSSPHVQKVYLGPNGVMEGAKDGSLMIDCSTIDPNVARSVSQDVTSRGVRMVDAPVSGGTTGAEAATLTFMVGGTEPDFKEASQLLNLMGKNIVHCGGSGNGCVAKVCNNISLAISMIGYSEAMNLGIKLGMDRGKLNDIINASSGQCWSSTSYNPCPGIMPNVPASNNYIGGFGVDLMRKDIGLANDAASVCGTSLPLGKAAGDVYKKVSEEGSGTKDFGIVFEYLKNLKA
eukprot:90841_1